MSAQGTATAAQLTTQPAERGHAMANTTKVRTTMTPGKVIEVRAAELTDLERQGLIHSRELAKGEKPRKGEKAWSDDKPDAKTPESDDAAGNEPDAETPESGVVTDTTPAELADKRKAAK